MSKTTAPQPISSPWPLALAMVLCLASGLLYLGLNWETSYRMLQFFSPNVGVSSAAPALLFSFPVLLLLGGVGVTSAALFLSSGRERWMWVVIGSLCLLAIVGSVAGGFRRPIISETMTLWGWQHALLAMALSAALVLNASLLARAPSFINAVSVRVVLANAMLLLYAFFVLDWETPGGLTLSVVARPLWLYPLLGGWVGAAGLLLARQFAPGGWSATLTALFFYGGWLLMLVVLVFGGNVPPFLPLIFIIAAFLLDRIPAVWQPTNRWLWAALQGLLFTIGFLVVAIPAAGRPSLPGFQWLDIVITIIGVYLGSAGLALLIQQFGQPIRLRD